MKNVSKMSVKLLKQELTQRGLPTHGLNLVERLEQAMQQAKETKKSNTTSNEDYHTLAA